MISPKFGKQEECNMDNYNGNTYARQDTDMSVGAWIGTQMCIRDRVWAFPCPGCG